MSKAAAGPQQQQQLQQLGGSSGGSSSSPHRQHPPQYQPSSSPASFSSSTTPTLTAGRGAAARQRRGGRGTLAQSTSAPTSKKKPVSLNHLLNFHFDRADESQQQQHQVSSARRAHHHHPPALSRTQYVHAAFRFVLYDDNGSTNYARQLADPDAAADWDSVAQVLVPGGGQECPICIDAPTCARVTRCGHVFCLPCVLHLFSAAGGKWAKCPVCFDSVHERDLRRALVVGSAEKGEDTIDMCLMQRDTNSTIALPRACYSTHVRKAKKKPAAPPAVAPGIMQYAKFSVASPEYLSSVAAAELAALDALDSEGADPFCVKARESITAGDKRSASSPQESPTSFTYNPSGAYYYFYQSLDGTPTFLHPFDIKLLKEMHGDYDKFPNALRVRVHARHEMRMTAGLRKRMKYLGNLPLGTSMVVVETNVEELCSVDVLERNRDMINERMKRIIDDRTRGKEDAEVVSSHALLMEAAEYSDEQDEAHLSEPEPFEYTSPTAPIPVPVEVDSKIAWGAATPSAWGRPATPEGVGVAAVAAEEDAAAPASGGKRKGRKRDKLVLFSTGGGHRKY